MTPSAYGRFDHWQHTVFLMVGIFFHREIFKTLTLVEKWIFLGESCQNIYYTVEPLLWDTSIKGTPPLRGHFSLSQQTAHIIFVFTTSIEETSLLRGWGHFLSIPKAISTSIKGTTHLLMSTKLLFLINFKCIFSSVRYWYNP